jgi:hypothetical protein
MLQIHRWINEQTNEQIEQKIKIRRGSEGCKRKEPFKSTDL